MIKIQTLSSGSSGNATYVGDEENGILIDIGLNLSQITKRLNQANIDPHSITAVFITHEHSDHICGVADFVSKYNAQIYCHSSVAGILKKCIKVPPHKFTEFQDSPNIGNIQVGFFPVSHNSQYCMGYTFTNTSSTVGIVTDIGKMTAEVLAHLSTCQVAVIESNHDVNSLLAYAKYPTWLKKRILSPVGHLSNIDCAHAIAELHKNKVSQIILAHLSKKNNSPSLAYNTVKHFLSSKGIIEGKDIFIDVASQDEIGNLYCID